MYSTGVFSWLPEVKKEMKFVYCSLLFIKMQILSSIPKFYLGQNLKLVLRYNIGKYSIKCETLFPLLLFVAKNLEWNNCVLLSLKMLLIFDITSKNKLVIYFLLSSNYKMTKHPSKCAAPKKEEDLKHLIVPFESGNDIICFFKSLFLTCLLIWLVANYSSKKIWYVEQIFYKVFRTQFQN